MYGVDSVDVFAISLLWPQKGQLLLAAPVPASSTVVTLMGHPDPLSWKPNPQGPGMLITIPVIPFNKMPCEWGWVFKLSGLKL
jgi:alpha-L-fucosidase